MSSTDSRPNARNNNDTLMPAGRGGHTPSRPPSRKEAEEQEKYNHLYQRIYIVFRRGDVDFRLLAQHTGLPERRLRETILIRFNPDDTRQLLGHRPGACYTCNRKIPEAHLREPLCLICLESATKAIQSLFPEAAAQTAEAPEPASEQTPLPPTKQPEKDVVQDILNAPTPGSFVVDTRIPPQESIRHFGFQRLKARN